MSARAHPRVCGENEAYQVESVTQLGSSPRVRGKPGDSLAGDRAVGLIPACAGKTPALSRQQTQQTAHPRVCGENTHIHPESLSQVGSSPRVRGKRCLADGDQVGSGLIPACAGKTTAIEAIPGSKGAHPRVCGENRVVGGLGSGPAGSSPRVRGKPSSFQRLHLSRRLIPACAGKT